MIRKDPQFKTRWKLYHIWNFLKNFESSIAVHQKRRCQIHVVPSICLWKPKILPWHLQVAFILFEFKSCWWYYWWIFLSKTKRKSKLKRKLDDQTSALSTVWKKKKIGVTKADKCTKTTSFRDLFKKQLRIQGSKGGNYYFLFEFRTRSKYSSMYSSSTSTDFTKLKSSTTSSKSFSSIYVVWTVFWQSWWIRK